MRRSFDLRIFCFQWSPDEPGVFRISQTYLTKRKGTYMETNEKNSETNLSPNQTNQLPQSIKTIKGVSVARLPNRQKYLVGDTSVDLCGGRLDLIYSDGSVGQMDMVADGAISIESQHLGQGKVSFACFGYSISFAAEILEPQVLSLSIAEFPKKKVYFEGEPLDLTGLVLEVAYNDGSIRPIHEFRTDRVVVTKDNEASGITLTFEGTPFTIPVSIEDPKQGKPIPDFYPSSFIFRFPTK